MSLFITMPAILLERLPLPSLRTYISFSIIVLGVAAFYAHRTVDQINTKLNHDISQLADDVIDLPPELTNVTLPYPDDEHLLNMLYVMRLGTWSVWTLVNSCYCLLILLGKLIQNVVFGELRVIEQQHLKDKFWNFVFYKFIFIFGVMNVQSMDEVVLWVAWFSGLGFLHLLTQLSKDRSEYLSFSPATPQSAHVKLLSLLLVILVLCVVLLAGCVWIGINVSFTIFTFLAAESVLVMLKCLYVVVRKIVEHDVNFVECSQGNRYVLNLNTVLSIAFVYIIQLWDMSLEGVWEGRSIYLYYTELVFELVALSVDFAHHMHMLFYGNIFLSMASLVICMQLRFLFNEFQRRLKRHKNYLRVVKDMESKFPMATQEDLEHNADDCAICWEKMNAARKLPCGHLFHNSCLRSWLEQDTSCPTCRTTLSGPNLGDAVAVPANQQTTNHFFHFDGSRYVSWLPSFSVEVTHTNLLPGQQANATQTSQLDNMAREVQTVFPNILQSVIMEDLRLSRSVDLTIDNILEGRIIVPPVPIASTGHQRNDSYGHASNSSTSEVSPSLSNPGSSVDSPQLGGWSLPNLEQTSQASPEPSVDPSELQSSVKPNVAAGSRFSKSASERMSMLDKRKQALLEQARRAYQNNQDRLLSAEMCSLPTDLEQDERETADENANNPALDYCNPENNSEEDVRLRRRAVLLEATQRRLDRNGSS